MKKRSPLTNEQIKVKTALDRCVEKQTQLGRELTKDEARQIYTTTLKELNALPKSYLPNFMHGWLARMAAGLITFWGIILIFAYFWSKVFHMGGR